MASTFSKTRFFDTLKTCSGNTTDWHLITHECIDSTSTYLVNKIKQGGALNTVVVADKQSAGRGRQGNVWFSDDSDNLYLSVSQRVNGNVPDLLPLVPLAAGVAAAYALKKLGFQQVYLKWPNDLLVEGRKIGGILCEAPAFDPESVITVVGLGLNLGRGSFPRDLISVAVNMGEIHDVPIAKEELAAIWVSNLAAWIKGIEVGDVAKLVEQWRSYGESFGRRVRVGTVEGHTVDLNDRGRLLVRKDDGGVVDIPGGIVENIG